jgi:hypothetical protein
MQTFPRHTTLLVGLALVLLGLFSTLLVGLRLSPYQAIEAAYYAQVDEGYLRYILPGETRAVTKVDDLRGHLLIDSILVALIGLAAAMGLARAPAGASAKAGFGLGAQLGLLGVGVVLLKFLSCHTSLPTLVPACGLFAKEGILDALHAVSFIGAGLLVAWAAWWLQGRPTSSTAERIAVRGTWLVAAGFVVLGLEEVSWGQTYLGWSTPPLLAEINDQQETNLHNIFNGYLTPIYYLLGFGALSAIILGELLARRWPDNPTISLLAPRAELFWLGAALVIASDIFVYSSTEAFESVLAMLTVLYAAGVLGKARAIAGAGSRPRTASCNSLAPPYAPLQGAVLRHNGSEA